MQVKIVKNTNCPKELKKDSAGIAVSNTKGAVTLIANLFYHENSTSVTCFTRSVWSRIAAGKCSRGEQIWTKQRVSYSDQRGIIFLWPWKPEVWLTHTQHHSNNDCNRYQISWECPWEKSGSSASKTSVHNLNSYKTPVKRRKKKKCLLINSFSHNAKEEGDLRTGTQYCNSC